MSGLKQRGKHANGAVSRQPILSNLSNLSNLAS
jgi:hypothetical protein